MQEMNKNCYGIPYIELSDLNDMKLGKFHYNYNEIDFMFNYKENSNRLVIFFHGTIRQTDKLPMFIKHNYDKENISVLTISDKILEYQSNNTNIFNRGGMHADHPTKQFHNTYIKIISECSKLSSTNMIFVGPCSGAKPALYFGSIFESIILILNGWIYMKDEIFLHCFKTSSMDKDINTTMINEIRKYNYDIEKKILESSPKHIYIYCNKQDAMSFQFNNKFIKFCKNNIPDKYTPIIFDYHNKEKIDAHMTFFPEGESLDSVLQKL